MNYIKHLSKVLEKFFKDDRLNPTHVSLYLALFQYWNLNRFCNPVSISRSEIMQLSKIGSKATYHKCIKELHHWRYLEYQPSHNPFKGSKVIMFNFCPSTEQVLVHSSSDNEQVLVHNRSDNEQALVPSKTYINNKHKNIYIDFESVKIYFLKNKRSEIEAEKFFNYYESTGWKTGGKIDINNWKAAARNWIIKADEIKKNQTKITVSKKRSNLHVNNDKDYGIPL